MSLEQFTLKLEYCLMDVACLHIVCGCFHPLFCQVLENNRNQLEAKGVQLAANKDQLQTISLQLETKENEVAHMRGKIGSLEKQLAGSLQSLLLQPSLPRQGSTKVCLLFTSTKVCLLFTIVWCKKGCCCIHNPNLRKFSQPFSLTNLSVSQTHAQ